MVTTVTRYQFNRTHWGCGAELTEGVIIKVEGFEGRNVSFQCSHTLAWKNHKYFCKDPCTRMEDILVTVESGRRAESGRITLVDSGNGSFSVTFSHLQLSDSQKYRCGVDRPGLDSYIDVHTLTAVYKAIYFSRPLAGSGYSPMEGSNE
uniref:Immunoglobulin V-set domain-containing protein n=1 Tax=Pundamilia nyererei TaxID=303518 RepID=A0A3B4F5K7_9CICH